MTDKQRETDERALMLGLWTSAGIAKQLGRTFPEFIKASVAAWEHREDGIENGAQTSKTAQ